MQKYLFTIVIALILASSCNPPINKEVKIISFAKLQDIMKPKADKTVYIYNFWATWCGPCTKELPHFDKVVRSYDDEVKMVLVSQNEEKELQQVQEYIDNNHYRATNYLLEKGNPNVWMPMINKDWDGAIPITIIKFGDKEFFHQGKMSEEFLRNEIEKIKE